MQPLVSCGFCCRPVVEHLVPLYNNISATYRSKCSLDLFGIRRYSHAVVMCRRSQGQFRVQHHDRCCQCPAGVWTRLVGRQCRRLAVLAVCLTQRQCVVYEVVSRGLVSCRHHVEVRDDRRGDYWLQTSPQTCADDVTQCKPPQPPNFCSV